MSQPFIGQIIAVGFNFAPQGWAFCDGSTLPISGNEALYNLIGTTYGGNGVTTFNLPDLRGRGVVGMGQGPGLSNYIMGQAGGSEQITLNASQIGAHTHGLSAATTATGTAPATNEVLGTPATQNIYATSGATTALSGAAVTAATGGGQPHENRQPILTINYIIALFGVYPPQN